MSRPHVRCLASRRRPGLAELGIVFVLYAVYELLRGVGDSSVHVARDHASDIVALERLFNVFIEQAVQDWAATIPTLPGLLGAFYVTIAPRRDRRGARLALPEPSRAFPARSEHARLRDGDLARRLRRLPRRAAAALGSRVRRHGLVAHAREPQLGPAREPLQPVRSRAEHALRLLADRRRRPRRVRTAPCRPHRRRSLPAFHALRHRRDREPLPVRRSDGRARRPRRLGRRARARPLHRVRLAAPRDARQRDVARAAVRAA